MAEQQQYSFVPPKTAQRMVRWTATLIGGAILPGIVFAFSWVKCVATTHDVDEKVEDQFRLYDPGYFALDKHDPRRVQPPTDGYAFAVAQCQRDNNELRATTKHQSTLLIEVFRIMVRTKAAESENNRAMRAATAANAVREFDRYVGSGMPADESFRRALEINPYSYR